MKLYTKREMLQAIHNRIEALTTTTEIFQDNQEEVALLLELVKYYRDEKV